MWIVKCLNGTMTPYLWHLRVWTAAGNEFLQHAHLLLALPGLHRLELGLGLRNQGRGDPVEVLRGLVKVVQSFSPGRQTGILLLFFPY